MRPANVEWQVMEAQRAYGAQVVEWPVFEDAVVLGAGRE
jgi:hypothetical protein